MSAGFKRAILAIMLLVASATATSGATYTAQSLNDQSFTAALDFGVTVSLTDPGSPLRDTVNLQASAAETGGGSIMQVVIQRSVAGAGSWTTICTDSNGAPWQCSWDTTGVADDQYDLRARATNQNGYTKTSTVVANRRVDNADPSVTLDTVPDWFTGTITLSASNVGDTGGSGLVDVKLEYKLTSAGTWTTACTRTGAPWSCTLNTASLTQNQSYDFRAVARDGATNETISSVTGKRPDHTNPSGTLNNPGTNLHGTVSLAGTATDSPSGVASWTVQYAPTGTTSWTTACVDTTSPFAGCDWATPPLDSVYDLRAVVTDMAGRTYTTATIASRRVDNGLPTTAITPDPGTLLSGTINWGASASDGSGSGVLNVAFQRSAVGANSWLNMCTPDTSSAYTCSWNSATVGDGQYDFRSLATDNATNEGASTILTKRVDNFTPSAAAIETADSSGTHDGIIEAGDTITLTYSEPIDPATLLAGWNGITTPTITLRFDHHNQGDRVLFYNAANTTLIPLATSPGVTFDEDYVPSSNPVYSGTLSRNTTGNVFTVTVGSGSGAHTTAPPASNLNWFPHTSARDFANKAVSNAQRGETGTLDVEF